MGGCLIDSVSFAQVGLDSQSHFGRYSVLRTVKNERASKDRHAQAGMRVS